MPCSFQYLVGPNKQKITMTYFSTTMPKSDKTKRAEVHLLPDVFEQLKKLAYKENRSLKNYMETLLINHVKEQKKKS
jgi:hypothetical protein